MITSSVFDFTERIPDRLMFYECRSNTATGYRLEVLASHDGINYDLLLNRFDTISSTSSYVQRIVNLTGDGLQQQPNVRFLWQLLGDNTNNTGMLRIDDISLTVATGFDLGVTEIVSSPINASRKDSLILSTTIKNYGSLAASHFTVRFFFDENLDDLAEPSEQFSVLSGFSLNPYDSLTCSAPHGPLSAGENRFIAVVDFTQDENRINDTARTMITIGYLRGDVLINEIMYAPKGDEPEWIELLNASRDTINLKNWRISDSNISMKSLISQADILLPPSSYLIVAKDITFSAYHPGVPFIMTSFAALNNTTSDAVVIFDPQICSIDSVMYSPSWGGQIGKSLERIDAEESSCICTNWRTSQDSLGSTPGRINSIARLDHDLAISHVMQTQTVIDGKVVPVVQVVVRNIGKNSVDSVLVRIYADSNRNTIPERTELLREIISTRNMNAGDSITVSESFPQLASGETEIIVVADYRFDERMKNNQTSITIKVSYELRSLIINEIMYDPLADQNEWIELLNRSTHRIDLAQWAFNDRATASGVNLFHISDTTLLVDPGCFVIVASDSSTYKLFPNLWETDPNICICILNRSGGFSFNNDGDAIVLGDLLGQTIDSVAYSPRWHYPDVVDTRGRSLERINPNIDSNDPRNWSTCTNILGGTPGKANSVFTTSSSSSTRISISPNPFSPDGDGSGDLLPSF